MELKLAGVIDDPRDQRWVVGEDPYALAEALHAGAHWIASENFETLRETAMETWLNEAQEQGRFTHVPRPFILRGGAAVQTWMGQAAGRGQSTQMNRANVLALAHAVTEPKRESTSLERRVAIIGTFGEDIAAGGMASAGAIIRQWHISSAGRLGGNPEKVRAEIEELRQWLPTARVQRTRDGEDRRIALESLGAGPTQKRTSAKPGHEV